MTTLPSPQPESPANPIELVKRSVSVISMFFMKKSFLFSVLIIIAASISKANTYDWSDLEVEKKYISGQDFRLTADVGWQAGDSFHLKSVYGLGVGSLIVFEFDALICTTPDLKTDVELVTPPTIPGDHRDRRVIVELDYDCLVRFYVEAADYYSPSIFKNALQHFNLH